VDVPEPVRLQALHPFRELPLGPKSDFRQVRRDGLLVNVNPWPTAQIVEVLDEPADLAAAVEMARAIAREHDKTILAWWLAPEHHHLAPALEELGLVNEGTPGFEATEHALALVTEPAGDPVEGVEARLPESFEEFVQAGVVMRAAFGLPEAPRDDLRRRYEESLDPERTGRQVIALIDDRVVGSSFAALGNAGVNLFGGSVAEDARGRGVYRAMTQARWQLAVERGTPALTVQAGRMSLPICERLGFVPVGDVLVYVESLDA
jgi:GNAT superfamily N-acetyltransferase